MQDWKVRLLRVSCLVSPPLLSRVSSYTNWSTMPNFDLVILDLDGTIQDLFAAGMASPRVQAAMAAVQATGVILTVGTGRTLDYIRTHLGYLDLRYPVITAHGGVIGDPQTGQIYAETNMAPELARPLLAWLDEQPIVTTLYVNDDAGHTHLYQNHLSSDPAERAFHDHVFGTPRTLQPRFSDLLADPTSHPPMKFLSDNGPDPADDIFPLLTRTFGDQLYITRSHPRLVEGMALGVDKGNALRQLCALLKIDLGRVLAIGDSDNDIPMLAAAGYGVAMGNATSGVKAVADWVAPSIEEDGAAVALERLVLG